MFDDNPSETVPNEDHGAIGCRAAVIFKIDGELQAEALQSPQATAIITLHTRRNSPRLISPSTPSTPHQTPPHPLTKCRSFAKTTSSVKNDTVKSTARFSACGLKGFVGLVKTCACGVALVLVRGIGGLGMRYVEWGWKTGEACGMELCRVGNVMVWFLRMLCCL